MPLPTWITRLLRRREPEPDVRRNLIFFDVTRKGSLKVISEMQACEFLYRLAVERGLSASLVDFEMYVFERLLQARRFDETGMTMEKDMDMPGLNEAFLRSDIMWLLRNRNRLVRDGLSAGGDAEYVFMQFQGNPEDLMLSMDRDINRRVIRVHYLSHDEINAGNHIAVSYEGKNTFFKMPEDQWTQECVIPILDHIVKLCQDR